MSQTLRDLRERAALSQAQLARLAGVDQTLIGKWERGEVPDPRGGSLNAVARVLGVGRDEIEAAIRATVAGAAA